MSAWRTVLRCTWCRSANSRMLSPSSRCWRRILSNSSTLDNSFSLAPTVWQPRSVGAGARGWGHLWPSLRPLLGPDQAVIPIRQGGLLPRAAQVIGQRSREAELGVGGDDQPGPAVGGLRDAELGGGPAQGLLEQPERVFKIASSEERLPEPVQVCGGG